MAQGKQAKVLSNAQVQAMLRHFETRRNADRNKVIFLLTVKAGLRAKEVAGLCWSSVLNSEGTIGDHIELTDKTSKGRSGRIIPMNREMRWICGCQLVQQNVSDVMPLTSQNDPSSAQKEVTVLPLRSS